MQTVISIEFDGQLRRIQAATPEDAVADLRGEYAEADPDRNVDLNTLTLECVTDIDTYPTWDEFEAQFRPVANHLDTNASYDGMMFETYGDELIFVNARPPENVWTLIDTGDTSWIVPGFHLVNRMGYIVTLNPWQGGQDNFLA